MIDKFINERLVRNPILPFQPIVGLNLSPPVVYQRPALYLVFLL